MRGDRNKQQQAEDVKKKSVSSATRIKYRDVVRGAQLLLYMGENLSEEVVLRLR